MTALLLSQYLSPVKEKVANVLFNSLLMDMNHKPSIFYPRSGRRSLSIMAPKKLKGKGYRVTFNAAGWHKLTGFCHV